MRNYLRQLFWNMGKTSKVVVCGMKGVGKTAILEQLIYGNVNLKSSFYATIEDIYVANIETDRGTKERVCFYDTAGLEPPLTGEFKGFSIIYFLSFHSNSQSAYWSTARQKINCICLNHFQGQQGTFSTYLVNTFIFILYLTWNSSVLLKMLACLYFIKKSALFISINKKYMFVLLLTITCVLITLTKHVGYNLKIKIKTFVKSVFYSVLFIHILFINTSTYLCKYLM